MNYERMCNLFTVLLWQHEAYSRHQPAKLNGESRLFDMDTWVCDTSACAYGSYALSVFCKDQFRFEAMAGMVTNIVPVEAPESASTLDQAAEHFDLTEEEVSWLFIPDCYRGEVADDDCEGLPQTHPDFSPRKVDEDCEPEVVLPYHVMQRVRALMYKYYPDTDHPELPDGVPDACLLD